MRKVKFSLSRVEHEKSFKPSGPGLMSIAEDFDQTGQNQCAKLLASRSAAK